jgi:DNA-binding transcriptional regulator YhcF (GntR family)
MRWTVIALAEAEGDIRLKSTLDGDKPIFQQIKEMIEEDILAGRLLPDEQIPSNSQLVAYFGINPVTVHKGITLLADEGLVYKKRGLGMFVSPDAPAILRKRHRSAFRGEYAEPLARQAVALGLTDKEVRAIVDETLSALRAGANKNNRGRAKKGNSND